MKEELSTIFGAVTVRKIGTSTRAIAAFGDRICTSPRYVPGARFLEFTEMVKLDGVVPLTFTSPFSLVVFGPDTESHSRRPASAVYVSGAPVLFTVIV